MNWDRAIDLLASQYGNWTSVVGLVISFLAWRQAKSAKFAAEATRRAVNRYNANQDIRRLIGDMNGLLPMHTKAAWNEVYFRYDPIREVALRLRTNLDNKNELERCVLDDLVAMLIDLAETVEKAMNNDGPYPDSSRINRNLRKSMQSLENFEVLKLSKPGSFPHD